MNGSEKTELMFKEIKAAGMEFVSIIGEVVLQHEKLIEIY
jgi:hypothetical protein